MRVLLLAVVVAGAAMLGWHVGMAGRTARRRLISRAPLSDESFLGKLLSAEPQATYAKAVVVCRECLARFCKVEKEKIYPDDLILRDLARTAGSLFDPAGVLIAIEDQFGCEVPEQVAAQVFRFGPGETVGEFCLRIASLVAALSSPR